MDENDRDPLGDLTHIVRTLLEEPDKLQSILKSGAKIDRDFFIFTCLGGCQDTYAINVVTQAIYFLRVPNMLPEEGELVTGNEEIICIIESLLELVEVIYRSFMERLNPGKYVPGSCFSPC